MFNSTRRMLRQAPPLTHMLFHALGNDSPSCLKLKVVGTLPNRSQEAMALAFKLWCKSAIAAASLLPFFPFFLKGKGLVQLRPTRAKKGAVPDLNSTRPFTSELYGTFVFLPRVRLSCGYRRLEHRSMYRRLSPRFKFKLH